MNTENFVDIDVAALPTGGQVQHALYGASGLLLLSAGSTITSSIKSLLANRGIKSVCAHQDDVETLLNRSTKKTSGPAAILDPELAKRLDEVIDDGLFGPKQSGPAVRDGMVLHDRQGYDAEQQEEWASQHHKASDSLSSMMHTAIKGGNIDGKDLRRMTAASLENMTVDCESALTVAMDAAADKGVSELSLQTSFLAMAIGIEMGLDIRGIRAIGTTGMVADWGMMYLPEDVNGLKGQLDERQFYEVQKVPIFTANMLQKILALPRLVLPLAYQVHEKIDGSGYPRGRKGNTIHLFARILHVADLYSSLTSPGSGKQPAMPYAAMESILREASKKFIDAEVTRALLRVLSLFPIGSYVALSNRSVGRVIRRNKENYSSPVVQIVLDQHGARVNPDSKDAIIVPGEVGVEITQALPTPGRNELTSAELLQLRWLEVLK